MNYSSIRQLDIANGPGCRVSIFVSGCEHRCKNCFNPETWNFNYGKAFTDQTMEALLELLKPEHISGLSILGGEPLHPQNREGVLDLVRKVKSVYPSKSIWIWTGYLWEEVSTFLIGSGIDVVVDGKFVEELKDLRLKYRGSSNQRVIDVWKSSLTGPLLLDC
jgi:anaerobic ribonucleoside-triphosphate reductase activating protein